MGDDEYPVLIVGGSLVGLSTALFLAHHGIRSLVVERHPGTAIHPRAAMFNQRTLELYRTVGLEEEINRRAGEEFLQDGAIMAVETLAGKELAWFLPTLNHGVEDVSPCRRLYCTQNVLEPILRRRAEELGALTQFDTEVLAITADADGVTVSIRERETGKERQLRAGYLVAADGNRSPTREKLGIAMQGHGTFSNSATIYFKADVRQALRERPLSVIYVNNSKLKGFMRFETHGQSGFLAVNAILRPDGQVSDVAADADDAKCIQMVRDAVGVPDLDVEIVVMQPWKAAADTARRFQDGRIFLAGDAAHVMPPTGGFGGNTGVHDAHNIAWKLALVLKGKAGPGLLDTYDAERRPASVFAVEQAYTRYVKRTDPSLGDHDIQPEEDDLRIELGYRYHSTAIAAGDQESDRGHEHPRESHALPGTRAPHVYIERRGERISTLDLYGKNFVLLAGVEGENWRQAAENNARDLGIAIDAHRIGNGGDIVDAGGGLTKSYQLAGQGAILVRPDGFVCWRCEEQPSDPEQTLKQALIGILSR